MKITPPGPRSASCERIPAQWHIAFHPPCINGLPEPSGGGEVQGDQLVEATDSDRVIPQSKQAEAAGEGLSALHPLANLINQKLRKGVCYFPSHITDTMCLAPRMQENTNRWPFSSELMLHANNQEGKQGQRNKLAACYPKGKQVIPTIGVFHTDNETLIIAAVQWVKSSWAHSDKGRLHTNH